jgi:hypothetical protein
MRMQGQLANADSAGSQFIDENCGGVIVRLKKAAMVLILQNEL